MSTRGVGTVSWRKFKYNLKKAVTLTLLYAAAAINSKTKEQQAAKCCGCICGDCGHYGGRNNHSDECLCYNNWFEPV